VSRHRVTLLVNGDRHHVTVEARRTLADVLRDGLRLTGTHLGCEQGVCGSCTVLMDGEPVRSCLVLAVQCDGTSVRTVEGLTGDTNADDPDDALHPLQALLGEEGGLQCGFCTPGFLMLLTGVLEERPDLDDEGLAHALSSNLCRCTGYAPIAVAARRARDLYAALASADPAADPPAGPAATPADPPSEEPPCT
jgi:carbon-monoxide dehydrogenase small subunit